MPASNQPDIPAKPHIAVFDIDGTLLKGDCLWIAAKHENGPLKLVLKVIQFLPFALWHILGRSSVAALKERFFSLFFGFPPCQYFPSKATQTAILNDLRPEALERLRWHQAHGHRVILCSASPRLLIQQLATSLSVELISTELQRTNKFWLPKLAGANCKGPEKTKRLEELIGPLDEANIEAYGDSKGDRELLQAASIPHYRSFQPQPKKYPRFNIIQTIPIAALAILDYGLIGIITQGDSLLPLLAQLAPEIGTGISLVAIGYAIRFLRWRLLMKTLGQKLPPIADLRIWMGSYAFTATPGKSGEAVRSILLKDELNVPIPQSLAALIIERITDGSAVLVLAFFNLSAIINWQAQLLPVAAGASVTIAIMIALSKVNALREFAFKNVAQIIPASLSIGSTETARFVWQLGAPKVFAVSTALGTVSWALEGTSLALLLNGMGITPPPFSISIISHTMSGLLGALSMLPGGLGSTEASTVGILSVHSIPLQIATSATILIRLMTLWLATLLGIACLLAPAPKNANRGKS